MICFVIIMYSFMCYFSKFDHVAHYEAKNKNTHEINFQEINVCAQTLNNLPCKDEKGHCQSEKKKRKNTHTELFPRQSWGNLRDRVENLWAFESAQSSY